MQAAVAIYRGGDKQACMQRERKPNIEERMRKGEIEEVINC